MKYILSIISTIAVLCSINNAFAETYVNQLAISNIPETAYVGDTITVTVTARDSNYAIVEGFTSDTLYFVLYDNLIYENGILKSGDIVGETAPIKFTPADKGIVQMKTYLKKATHSEYGAMYLQNPHGQFASSGSLVRVLPRPHNSHNIPQPPINTPPCKNIKAPRIITDAEFIDTITVFKRVLKDEKMSDKQSVKRILKRLLVMKDKANTINNNTCKASEIRYNGLKLIDMTAKRMKLPLGSALFPYKE